MTTIDDTLIERARCPGPSPSDLPPGMGPTVHRGSRAAEIPPGSVVAIGNFDGVHLGHQAVLHGAMGLAKTVGGSGEMTVLTFDPHPAKLFAPDLAPPLITTLAQRLEWLGQEGADHVVVESFDEALASLAPEEFVHSVLADRLGAAGVVVGYDFTFGRGGAGDTDLLVEICAQRDIQVRVVPPFYQDGILVSSTKVREFLLSGRVYGASLLLGRPFEISGLVVKGAGRGRTLGFPTANVAAEQELVPAFGVYAARARVGAELLDAAVSIGIVPTFKQDQEVTVEAYLMDFDGDLYERPLCLQFVKRVRPERRFESVDALTAQIALDVKRVRDILLTL